MSTDKLTVLFTGAGSAMGQSVIKAFMASRFAAEARIVVTNSDPVGAGFFFLPKLNCYLVPLAKDPAYPAKIEEICLQEGVNVIFSGTEHEIYALSNLKERFWQQHHIHIALSEPRVIEIGTDKLKTWEFFRDNNLPFPETALFSDYKRLVEKCGWPLFMKPRTASASRNIFRIANEQELFERQFAKEEEILLQSYLDSPVEYTVEAYADRVGKVVGVIPMRRDLDYGLSVSGEIDSNQRVIELCTEITRKLRPQGALNIQLRVVQGKPIPFELNTRFSSTECIRAHFGFNSVEAEIEHFFYGRPVDLSAWRPGRFIRYWEECYYTEEQYRQLASSGMLPHKGD